MVTLAKWEKIVFAWIFFRGVQKVALDYGGLGRLRSSLSGATWGCKWFTKRPPRQTLTLSNSQAKCGKTVTIRGTTNKDKNRPPMQLPCAVNKRQDPKNGTVGVANPYETLLARTADRLFYHKSSSTAAGN